MLSGENSCMAAAAANHHRVGQTGLSDYGPSSSTSTHHHHQPLPYGIQSPAAAATNFFDQEGAAYFGELEEALMQGVVGINRSDDQDRKRMLALSLSLFTRGQNGVISLIQRQTCYIFKVCFKASLASKIYLLSPSEKAFFTTRPPPTLEIFPSWPMRSHQSNKGSSQSAESTDSGSAQYTISQLESESPVRNKNSSEQTSCEPKQQEMMMMASDASRIGAAAPNHQLRPQDKRRVAGSTTKRDGKPLDAKTLRRLAQNREAAKKSRLRKKAYVQQLETSRMKLAQLEQDLQRARSQGLFLGGANAGGNISSGAAVFDMEYARWLDENYKHMTELRGGLQAHLPDGDLRVIVDECLVHYNEVFRLKGIAAKSDVFHLITGMWTTPAERCFIWMGGFRPSDLLKILMPQLDPLTEQQLVGICNLQQSSQQAEEALSQGLEQLQQSLANTVASGSLNEAASVGNYMGHMAMALGKLSNLEGFVLQADNLRQQTLHQLCRILTIRQAARCFLAIGEYYSRLRALSSLWASRPRENMFAEESICPTTTDLQIIHQPAVVHTHFSAF